MSATRTTGHMTGTGNAKAALLHIAAASDVPQAIFEWLIDVSGLLERPDNIVHIDAAELPQRQLEYNAQQPPPMTRWVPIHTKRIAYLGQWARSYRHTYKTVPA